MDCCQPKLFLLNISSIFYPTQIPDTKKKIQDIYPNFLKIDSKNDLLTKNSNSFSLNLYIEKIPMKKCQANLAFHDKFSTYLKKQVSLKKLLLILSMFFYLKLSKTTTHVNR